MWARTTSFGPVSYTHLDVYKRQGQRILPTRDVRLARRIVRDYQFRGHSPQRTLSMWADVCRGEDENIKVLKPEADLLLDTSFSY